MRHEFRRFRELGGVSQRKLEIKDKGRPCWVLMDHGNRITVTYIDVQNTNLLNLPAHIAAVLQMTLP